MSSDKPSNVSGSDATSLRSQPIGKLSESDYLARQAADALDAIKQALNDMGTTIVRTTDLPGRVNEHPLISISAAAALGFLASSFIPLAGPAKIAAAAAPLLRRAALAAIPLIQQAAASAARSAAYQPASPDITHHEQQPPTGS